MIIREWCGWWYVSECSHAELAVLMYTHPYSCLLFTSKRMFDRMFYGDSNKIGVKPKGTDGALSTEATSWRKLDNHLRVKPSWHVANGLCFSNLKSGIVKQDRLFFWWYHNEVRLFKTSRYKEPRPSHDISQLPINTSVYTTPFCLIISPHSLGLSWLTDWARRELDRRRLPHCNAPLL